MKTLIAVLIGTPTVIGVTYLCFEAAQMAAAYQQPEARVPFTLRQTVTSYTSAGVQSFSRTQTFAIRRDGSQVEVREEVNGKPVNIRVVYDLAAKKRIVIDHARRSLTTYPLSDEYPRQLAGAPGCSTSGSPSEKALGFDVIRRVRTEDFRDQTVKISETIAPALGCYALQREDVIERHGVLYGRQVTNVTAVVMGDPDSSLFQIPAGYAER
jgi:hypothetical protein